MRKKLLSLLLVSCMILCMFPSITVDAAFENTYVLTGNQRKDILGVAMTQLGYIEGPYKGVECGNDTKYGDWYGYPYQEWCAMFVSWCARQADISTSILRNSCRAGEDKENFNIACYKGTEYTPKPGDLYFKEDFSHVGLVYEVKGDIVITLEGNVNYEGVSEIDGFTVAFLERKLSESRFGVPEYEGCDTCPATKGEHKYTRKHDKAHPHDNYFECDACGDLYYTGSHAHLTDCKTCMSCGCSTDYAGLYKVVGVKNNLNLYDGHGTYYRNKSIAELDSIVEVKAGDGQWAHIVDGPYVYYGSMSNLKRYVPAPGNVKTQTDLYIAGENANITWDPAKTATAYQIKVLRNGKQIFSSDLGNQQSYELKNLQPGNYEVSVTASYAGTVSAAGKHKFKVLERYDVIYDGRGGTNVPEKQQKIEDQTLTLSALVPVKEGYKFLGWSDNPKANYSNYQPIDTLTENKAVTLYAIWQSNSATAVSMEIETLPKTTTFLVGDPLNTQGMVLMLQYSDGSAKRVTEGFETTGFNSKEVAEVTLTVICEGVSANYQITILKHFPGDINQDREVNKEDVMQLLWHISFPDMFPIDIPADFTGDGKTNKEDVMQLLWHISFPDMFPLK